MKRWLCTWVVTLALLTALFSAAAAASTDISGVYEGYYFATQGQTGLTLTVEGDKAFFEFYNLPGRSNAKEGSFWMDVTEKDGVYSFQATEWVEQPSGWDTVDLSGSRWERTLTGKVLFGSGNYEFYLELPTEAYEQVRESIYEDHRYLPVNQAMTWAEAQAYCAEQGGYLATVTSQGESGFLQGLIGGEGNGAYWLGGLQDDGAWRWDNGERWGYTNWGGTAPIGTLGLTMGESGTWTASAPGEKHSFVCEWGTWSGANEWSSPELGEAAQKGLIPDVLIGADMTKPVTRGEFAAIAVKLYEAITGGRAIIAADCPLTDIADSACRSYILKAFNLNIVNGVGENRYKPEDVLTREQLATMLCRVYQIYNHPEWTLDQDADYPLDTAGVAKFADDAHISNFAKRPVYFMVKTGVINGVGDNKFAPKNATTQEAALGYANATREQAVALALRSLDNWKAN